VADRQLETLDPLLGNRIRDALNQKATTAQWQRDHNRGEEKHYRGPNGLHVRSSQQVEIRFYRE
jgi:hypothetical protein